MGLTVTKNNKEQINTLGGNSNTASLGNEWAVPSTVFVEEES